MKISNLSLHFYKQQCHADRISNSRQIFRCTKIFQDTMKQKIEKNSLKNFFITFLKTFVRQKFFESLKIWQMRNCCCKSDFSLKQRAQHN